MLQVVITVYLFFTVLLTAYIAAYTLNRGSSPLARSFAAMSFCLCIYIFGYLLELNSTTIEQMFFWNQVQYLTLPFFPSFWLLVSLNYSGNRTALRPLPVTAIFLIPVITFIVRLTNPYHHLFYSSISLNTAHTLTIMHLEKGLWYLVNSAYLVIIYLYTAFIYLNITRKDHLPVVRQNKTIFIAITLPVLGLVMNVTDAGRIGLDYAALLLPVTILLMSLVVFKYDFLQLKSLARETVFENSTDAMVLVDAGDRLVDYNPAAAAVLQELREGVKGASIVDIFKNLPDLLAVYKQGQTHDLKLAGGKYYEVSVMKVEQPPVQTFGYLVKLTDITARKKTQEQLFMLATKDALTGLNNRRHFLDLASKEFALSKRHDTDFSLLMIDVDRFKAINDRLGHAGGDAVLEALGRKMSSFFRKTDMSGRLGGEEFAVLLPKTGLDDAFALAEKFREEVARAKIPFEDKEVVVTISLGVTAYSSRFENFEQLLQSADDGLYRAKSRGRNCSAFRSGL